ncbi:MAG TPA: TVP38/TMEM64 family protein [Ornithinibacter sp.]|nr:TVP38/TMEM64 family protein [Ornithinibacter sp.]
MTSTQGARLRLLALGVAVLIAGGLVWLLLGGDVDEVQTAVAATGAWGPVAYVVMHLVLTLVPVSKNLLSGVAGALFGLAGGIAISWVASMLSAILGFAIARRLGREAVAGMTGPRIDRVEDILRQQGVAAVIVARLTPVLPFTIVNYGAGVSAVSLRDFLVGTAVGIVPGTVAYAALGASAGRDAEIVAAALAVGAVLLVGSIVVARRMTRRSSQKTP